MEDVEGAADSKGWPRAGKGRRVAGGGEWAC
jgi:hypothetical protein